MTKELRKSYDRILYIDDREPPEVVELLAEQCPIPIEIKRQRTTDYVCGDVYIERKSVSDFAGSIVDKRLFKQFDRLAKLPHPYILIAGSLNDVSRDVSRHSILGALAYVCTKGVTVVKVDSTEDFVYLVLKIFERHGCLKLWSNSPHQKV